MFYIAIGFVPIGLVNDTFNPAMFNIAIPIIPIGFIVNTFQTDRLCSDRFHTDRFHTDMFCLGTVYIFPGSVCLFCCREICGPILGKCKSLTDT